ncbi:PA2779 family protein [Desulfovibrio subterraneus]|jgi:hypothetical protein|uniref:PA2779 family protein n=1 Tax=Desulfovibrio subterraneus TaxID=2718620 RepID=A0A7J0BPF4_9BACT|nr:PA2779 family protein [Desulfovibrio subterraneus]WBF66639.1 PA2779 family protein [Desulfovibrio subterraneus]GFM35092.1 hypothetical protein DSM101010T_34570 [Desulfovibrio subterraneus]
MNTFIRSHLVVHVALFMALIMSMMAFVPDVDASFVPTSQSSSVELRAQDMTAVQNTLENKMVTERLANLGYSPDEINTRLGMLSDGELHSLASQLGSLDAGGSALGLIVVILVIVTLGLVIYQLI